MSGGGGAGSGPGAGPRLYDDLSDWWPLLSDPSDYAGPAATFRRILSGGGERPLERVLELGSGGGNNAAHLKAHFRMALVDRSEGMLAVSKRLNPECEHILGDMRTVRVGRTFDAVFVHDAASYLAEEGDLRLAAETAFVHCRSGGVALFCPDYVRETFRPATTHGGRDGADGRGLRYIEWTWDPDPADTTYVTDFAYLLRGPHGTVRVEPDRHVLGLLRREDWLSALREAGFVASAVAFDHAGTAGEGAEGFVGVKR